MIVRNFLQWAQKATAAQRAEGAGALARAYLYSEMDAPTRRDSEIALMSLLDDPSPVVRRALADNFASAADAHIRSFPRSPATSPTSPRPFFPFTLVDEAELIDCAAVGDAFAQSAIALRAACRSASARL